jgi:hypothetical protein
MKQEKEDKSITLIEAIRKYIDLKWEYFQLTAAEKVSLLVGNIVFFIVIALLGLVLFFLIILLIDNLLKSWIDITWLVSCIEIAFVGILIFILYKCRKSLIIKPAASVIIQTIFSSSDSKTKEGEETDEEK